MLYLWQGTSLYLLYSLHVKFPPSLQQKLTAVVYFFSKGQQTLSEEVSEKTTSQILKLEKENQSLLKIIEELRTNLKFSHHDVCSTNNSLSTEDSSMVQTSCSLAESLPDVYRHNALTQNGHSSCHQEPVPENLEGVHSEIFLTNNPEHFNKILSDLDVLQNTNNKLHCVVGSDDPSYGSKSSSPCHDIFTDLPARSSYAIKLSKRLEVKCRGLHTANQQLQTSLYNAGRSCRSIKH